MGAIIAKAEPVFQVIRWAGVAYLVYLGVQALRSALRSGGADWTTTAEAPAPHRGRAFRQGFLCNITNPKVLAFNVAVLPQFLGSDAGLGSLLAYALTLTAIGALVLLAVVLGADAAKRAIASRRARRSIDGAAGVVFIGFATALAAEA